MSIIGVIGVVLVLLKLFGLITLSWWIVLIPFYGIFFLLACAILAGTVAALGSRK